MPVGRVYDRVASFEIQTVNRGLSYLNAVVSLQSGVDFTATLIRANGDTESG
jgi:hypothetical protein